MRLVFREKRVTKTKTKICQNNYKEIEDINCYLPLLFVPQNLK